MIGAMSGQNAIHCMIRQADANDAAAIAELGRVTFAAAYAAIVPPKDMATYVAKVFAPSRIIEEMSSSNSIYIIAELASEIIGYAKLVFPSMPLEGFSKNDSLELERLYLAHHLRGQGVGEKLLMATYARGYEAGYLGLWLRVWQKNKAAIHFYRKHGFEIFGSEPYLIGKTANPVVLMHAPLGARVS